VTAALPRFRVLAAYVRGLDDDTLNDLLVELPRERFAALVEVCLARPSRPAELVLRFLRVPRHPGEVSRWRVLAHAGSGRQVVLGEVAQERSRSLGGGEIATWRVHTHAGEPDGHAHRLDGSAAAAGIAAPTPRRRWLGPRRPAARAAWPWPPASAPWTTSC
jgi:hypothetical protein